MKNIILFFFNVIVINTACLAQTSLLPDSIPSGKQGSFHVQGMLVDQEKGVVYFSFTDRLVKTDLSGNMIGSVTGFIGHLGDLDFSADGKIFGSLEYKNDAIGKGIKTKLGIRDENKDGFYVAIFDGAKITRPGMNAEEEDLLQTVYIKEATADYLATVKLGEQEKQHRFACSGIDGIAFAPAIGANATHKKFLYVAYGIYGDNERNDNDHQVILKYDVTDWGRYAKKLSQTGLHRSGPKKPLEKYFVRTGNTRYGIQNLAYDASSGNLFAAVYKGSKPQFPNYDLFVINGKQSPSNGLIISDNKKIRVKTLSLLEAGIKDVTSSTSGWFFPWGTTGICPLGDGLFYISHPKKTSDGQQQTMIYKYKWLGDQQGFHLLK
ncbi:MAG: hypothetical protein EOO92_00825 [Pedobacter sp.]|nr:MAG: hypothetical protein EOO92_00825 [Pedobacter sp.]